VDAFLRLAHDVRARVSAFCKYVLFTTPRRLPQVLGLAEVTAAPTPWPVAGMPSHKIPSFGPMIVAYRQGSPLKRVYYHTLGRRSGFVR
jgi:hypothetical protein